MALRQVAVSVVAMGIACCWIKRFQCDQHINGGDWKIYLKENCMEEEKQ